MKNLTLSLLLFAPVLASADLVAWFPLNGSTKDVVRGTAGELKGDSRFSNMDKRPAADFGGRNGVLFVPDSPQFALGPSFSVSAQVWIRALPTNGTSPQGQIVFRGDDRSACDNYSLCLGNDGYFTFRFDADACNIMSLRVPARTNTWVALLGTFDAKTRHVALYMDGFLVAEQYSPFNPIMLMEKGAAPGFSIGNVQNPFGGCHNQPFNGLIRDVKIFNSVATWDDVIRQPKEDRSLQSRVNISDLFLN